MDITSRRRDNRLKDLKAECRDYERRIRERWPIRHNIKDGTRNYLRYCIRRLRKLRMQIDMESW
jgi:hypothetical protein